MLLVLFVLCLITPKVEMQALLRPLVWRGTSRVLGRPTLAFRTFSALNFGRKTPHINLFTKYTVCSSHFLLK